MIKEEQADRVKPEARLMAEERVLDVLLPPSRPRRPERQGSDAPGPLNGPGFVIQPPEGEQNQDDDLRERTRERFRKMIRNGEMDDREIEIDVVSDSSPTLQMFGPMGMEEMGINMQELFGNLGQRKRKRRRMPVKEALELLAVEEAQKLIDMDAVQKEAIERVQQAGIVFIDEIDKVAGGAARQGGPDVSREGVQRDLLPIVEGSSVTTKYGLVKTDHILFIASGAFHVSKPSDLIPELQGRFPIRVELNNLTEDDFVAILTTPKNALLKQYEALLATEGVSISFTDGAVRAVAAIAAQVNEEVENIGARRLHTILTTLLEEILFEVPDVVHSDAITITEEYVRERLDAVVQNRDLSQYIL
jgi:ATP-dependent HslUV protease ATP-binding subunit HslU